MIVDTSAIVAIVLKEPGFEVLIAKIQASTTAGMGTPSLAEAAIVLSCRLKLDGRTLLGRLMVELELVPVSFGEPHWREAVRAYDRYGRGRHPAALNFGDCMSYAIASLAGKPLLFTGADFSRTDLTAA